MMTKEKYQNLKTDSAHNQIKALQRLVATVGDSIDDAVQQMTYATGLSSQFKSWMKKWVDEDAVIENDLSEANKLSHQITAILSGLQSMSQMVDKVWLKTRKMPDRMPPEIR